MAYADFLVTQGSSASDVNGGSAPSGASDVGTNDGPLYTSADVDSDGAGTTLTDNSGSDWGTAAADDWLCFDTAGGKEFARIVSKPTASTVTVTPAVSISLATETANVGGAWATIQHGLDTLTTAFVSASGDPPCLNIKKESAAYNEPPQSAGNFSTTVPLTISGYQTTFRDEPAVANLPEINDTTGTSVVGAFRLNHTFHILTHVYVVTAKSNDEAVYCSNQNNMVRNVRAKATGTSAAACFYVNSAGANCRFFNCWAESSSGDGFRIEAARGDCTDCVSTDAATYGFYTIADRETMLIRCTADTSGDDGFYIAGEGFMMESCNAYNNTGSGVRLDDPTDATSPDILNCLFINNGGYGIECDTSFLLGFEDFNAFYNNTSGEVLNVPQRGSNDVTLTGDPFTDAANQDWSLNNTAGAGAACRAVGFPGTHTGGSTTGYRDIGPYQHQDAGGGGGGGGLKLVGSGGLAG